ncbi:hypothetical protein RB213_001115 [Colletotrichum asianum]
MLLLVTLSLFGGLGCVYLSIIEGLREEGLLLRIARDTYSLYAKAIRSYYRYNRLADRVP